jgi:Tol biopolymer transport system component
MGWAFLAVGAVFMLSSIIRSLIPNLSVAAGETPTQIVSFEQSVRAGHICKGPLAAGHNYSAFITNADKTGFVEFDEQKVIGELRALAMSPDGKQLAVVGNTTGTGNIYLADTNGGPLQPVLANSELGYLMDVAWSRDGKQLLTWSLQDNTIVYVMNTDGTGLVEKQLPLQMLATPQFTPDGESIVFYGTDTTSTGLFEVRSNDLQTRMVSAMVEDESSFAWSPDGSQLAYIEMDRSSGEAHLVLEDANNAKAVIGTLPIPKGSGSSLPESANLSWSRDGKILAFEFGRSATDRAIYLAHADGSGLVKAADAAHAPAISADGNCLAYISNKQVFLLDMKDTSSTGTTAPILVTYLPVGRAIADFRLDRLQWGSK